jgi:hypothetical protein
MHDFSVVHLEGGQPQWRHEVVYPGGRPPWRLHEIEVAPGYQAAVAAGQGCELRLEEWSRPAS